MASTDIETVLAQLESLAASPPQDEKLQQRLYDATQKLSLAVEAPLDTVYRVIYSVRQGHSSGIHRESRANNHALCTSPCF